jgi:hypothetical protein
MANSNEPAIAVFRSIRSSSVESGNYPAIPSAVYGGVGRDAAWPFSADNNQCKQPAIASLLFLGIALLRLAISGLTERRKRAAFIPGLSGDSVYQEVAIFGVTTRRRCR